MSDLPLMGTNIGDTVYCALCDWRKGPLGNMERIEFELKRHIQEVHGRDVFYRKDENNVRTEIP